VRPAGTNDTVTVLRIQSAVNLQGLQEAATLVRSIAEIRKLYVCALSGLIAMRGSDAQTEVAQWLATEFDRADAGTGVAAVKEFAALDPREAVVAIYYLKGDPNMAAFQRRVTEIRKTTQTRRVFTLNGPRAMVVRSTPEQVAAAGRLAATPNE
jgi:hypothetical protein